MNHKDFLDLAKRLSDDKESKDVEFRTSISRAFNYAFIDIRNRYWNDSRVIFKGGEGDKILVRELLGAAKQKFLMEQWRNFTKDRNDAEYYMDTEFEKTFVDEYIKDIEDFLADIKSKVRLKKKAN